MTSYYKASEKWVVNGKYKIIMRIGCTSNSSVYKAVHVSSGEEVAIKMERLTTSSAQLLNERKVLKIIGGGVGVPRLKWYGEEKEYRMLVIDLLGASLQDLFEQCSRKFTMKTVLMLADQMIPRLEYVHRKGFTHRDVKPNNFVVGIGRHVNTVFLIDFGLAGPFRDLKSGRHLPFREDIDFAGTAFTSVNADNGREQSRRDDMESLGYTLMYFNRGSLPWQEMKAENNRQLHDRMVEMKMSTTVEKLCEGYPDEFIKYLNYCRRLNFEDCPNYIYLRQLFSNLFRKLNYLYDKEFDWTVLEKNKAKTSGAVAAGARKKPTGVSTSTSNVATTSKSMLP